MWSCSDVGQEILAVGECLAKRSKTATKSKCQNMENGMVDNVVTKIEKMQLSITNGQELYDYISQSKMSEEHKAKLVLCVDEKLSTPTQEEPRQGFVVKPQLLVNIGSYMTAADWSQLEDPSLSWLAKSTVVIKRLKMLGVRSLHERTSQHCLAALLSTLSKLPDHSMIWEMLLSFKATFKQSEIPHAVPYLQTFPASPQDLPAHIFNVAYVGDDQPIENKNIDVIKHIAGSHISCRSTNKLLKSSGDNSKGQSAKGQPASAAEVAAGEQHQQAQFDPMKMCATMMQAMCATMARQGQFANMFNTNTEVKISPKKKEPKALEDGTAAAGSSVPALPAPSSAAAFEPKKRTAAEANLPEKHENDAEAEADGNEFEQAAYSALVAREEKKKPVPKAKGKATGKPKGKAKAVMKRPSSKALEFEVPKPTAADLEKKVNVYASRVWHQARLFAKNTLMLDDEAAKAFAKPKGQKAREMFNMAMVHYSKK